MVARMMNDSLPGKRGFNSHYFHYFDGSEKKKHIGNAAAMNTYVKNKVNKDHSGLYCVKIMTKRDYLIQMEKKYRNQRRDLEKSLVGYKLVKPSKRASKNVRKESKSKQKYSVENISLHDLSKVLKTEINLFSECVQKEQYNQAQQSKRIAEIQNLKFECEKAIEKLRKVQSAIITDFALSKEAKMNNNANGAESRRSHTGHCAGCKNCVFTKHKHSKSYCPKLSRSKNTHEMKMSLFRNVPTCEEYIHMVTEMNENENSEENKKSKDIDEKIGATYKIQPNLNSPGSSGPNIVDVEDHVEDDHEIKLSNSAKKVLKELKQTEIEVSALDQDTNDHMTPQQNQDVNNISVSTEKVSNEKSKWNSWFGKTEPTISTFPWQGVTLRHKGKLPDFATVTALNDFYKPFINVLFTALKEAKELHYSLSFACEVHDFLAKISPRILDEYPQHKNYVKDQIKGFNILWFRVLKNRSDEEYKQLKKDGSWNEQYEEVINEVRDRDVLTLTSSELPRPNFGAESTHASHSASAETVSSINPKQTFELSDGTIVAASSNLSSERNKLSTTSPPANTKRPPTDEPPDHLDDDKSTSDDDKRSHEH